MTAPRPACSAPASVVLEGYGPSDDGLCHGVYVNTAYVCGEHAHLARTQWFPGLTPFTALTKSAAGHVCGEIHDLRTAGR